MKSIKLILSLAVALFVILLGVLFTIHNTDRVSIDLIWFQLPEASLSLWLVAAFALGILVGIVLTGMRNLSLSAKLQAAGRRQRKTELQLQKIKEGA